MSLPRQQWVRSLLSSSLFRPPPQNSNERQIQVLAYVELFRHFASESFVHDISELVRCHYPHKERCLVDDVLVTFLLQHPEHGHAILHAFLSCIIDGTIIYNKNTPPFESLISLFNLPSEKALSQQWALACGEILKILTHYNRPIYNTDSSHIGIENMGGSPSFSNPASGCEVIGQVGSCKGKKASTRLLTPWITDSLLAAPLGVRSDYFRWCGGVMGKYAAGGELKPPMTVGPCESGKCPQLMPSTPRWAVANGAAVILSVCDDELFRHRTADLTAAAVPALLLPPPIASLDAHLVAGLPPLEPYARLFHRYYALATPCATQQLFLGLLEAPSSWAPDALDSSVQLVELLRAAEDYSSRMQLPWNWLHLHFLRPIGIAMATQPGLVADAAAALLFRLFSQPVLLFPAPGHAQGVHGRPLFHGSFRQLSVKEQLLEKTEAAAAKVAEEATAKGIASLMCDHGPDVERRVCILLEAAYGLLPLDSPDVKLPEQLVATPLQVPFLSWNLFQPLVWVLNYLPHGSRSEACLLRVFTATVENILLRTFPIEEYQDGNDGFGSQHLEITELRAMVHSLFTGTCPSEDLAVQLLLVAITVCFRHDAMGKCGRESNSSMSDEFSSEVGFEAKLKLRASAFFSMTKKRAVSTFETYIIAALCGLACELQFRSISAPMVGKLKKVCFQNSGSKAEDILAGANSSSPGDVVSSVDRAKRLLRFLEVLLTLCPSPSYNISGRGNSSSGALITDAMVATRITELLGRTKACMHALTAIMYCKWDFELPANAASVLALLEGNVKVAAAICDIPMSLSSR